MSPKSPPPRERYASPPWKPGEEAEARERIRAEVARGTPILVEPGNDLTFTFLSASIDASGAVSVLCRVTGKITRPDGVWECKGEAVGIGVPAVRVETSTETSRDASQDAKKAPQRGGKGKHDR